MTNDFNIHRPRRLRLIEAGWEGFSDFFGTVQFKDGVSVEPVAWVEQQRLGGMIRMVSAEDGENDAGVGPAEDLTRGRDRLHTPELVDAGKTIIQANGVITVAGALMTRQELEAVADAKGLAGLRDVAKPWGVTDRSVIGLINAILRAQTEAAAQGAAPETPRVVESPVDSPVETERAAG